MNPKTPAEEKITYLRDPMEILTTPITAWRATPRIEELERTYWQDELDDSEWPSVSLPHQWTTSPGFEKCRGPVVYRARFDTAEMLTGRRARIRANGVFYFTHVWLDEAYLGDGAGYFCPHEFECTEQIEAGTSHLLAIEIESPDQHDRSAKTVVTGVFSHWDSIDPTFNPGGIWQPVDLVLTGPVFIRGLLALPRQVTPRHARMDVKVSLNAAVAGPINVRASLRHLETAVEVAGFERTWTIPAGDNTQVFILDIENPELWWPHTLGDQPLYQLSVEIVGPDGDIWDRQARTIGIRTIDVTDWIFSVNGERLFIRGSNYAPTRQALGAVTAEDVRTDLQLAREANLDLLRVHGHVAHPLFYEAADRAGVLLWQDFPLQWDYSRRVKRSALEQASLMVSQLGSHPSVAMWCCHNEPIAVETTDSEEVSAWQRAKVVASSVLPTWNKNVLDPALRRTITEADPSRFCNEKSGEIPNTLSYGTDSHLYFGWYLHEMRRFGRMTRLFPRMFRFVSEFGAQALPSDAALAEFVTGNWPDINWEELSSHHSLQAGVMDRYVPRDNYSNLADYREATQQHQATVIKYHVERLRRLKYGPTGGFCQFQFQDAYPAITWSVIDHLRRPKIGLRALREACAPVLVMADWPEISYAPGDVVSLDLYVVSELRRPLLNLRLATTLADTEHEWVGEVPADSVVHVGRLEVPAPANDGTYTLALQLFGSADALLTQNSYEIAIGR